MIYSPYKLFIFFIIRRILNLSRTSREAWNRSPRSRVPYTRTTPSDNHAYEHPIDADLLNNEDAPRSHVHGAAPAHQPPFEGPPTRASHQYQIPPPRSQWPSENPPNVDPPPYTTSASVPPIHAIPEQSHNTQPPTESSIYSNVRRQNRPHPKTPHGQHRQSEPVVDQHQPETFPCASSTRLSSGSLYRPPSAPWLCGDTTYFSEDAAPLQPPRLRAPRTPDSPFTTINPMYHSRPVWETQPSNAHFKHTTLS